MEAATSAEVRAKTGNASRSLSIFRSVNGQNLARLYNDLLIPLEQKVKGIELPYDRRGEKVSPRTQIVKHKELWQNRGLIGPQLAELSLQDVLTEKLPELELAKIAQIERVEVDRCRRGDQYMQLFFGEESSEDLAVERANVWWAIEEVAGEADLDWKDYSPDIRLAFFERTIQESSVDKVADYISKHLPMSVTLGPVESSK